MSQTSHTPYDRLILGIVGGRGTWKRGGAQTKILILAWAFCAGLKATLVETKSEPFSIILSIKSDRVKVKESEHVTRR